MKISLHVIISVIRKYDSNITITIVNASFIDGAWLYLKNKASTILIGKLFYNFKKRTVSYAKGNIEAILSDLIREKEQVISCKEIVFPEKEKEYG